MERPIGEIFDYKKHKLQVVEGCGCEECYFEGKICFKKKKRNMIGWCDLEKRPICSKSVIFKKI